MDALDRADWHWGGETGMSVKERFYALHNRHALWSDPATRPESLEEQIWESNCWLDGSADDQDNEAGTVAERRSDEEEDEEKEGAVEVMERDARRGVIFAVLSRINHSCEPNCRYVIFDDADDGYDADPGDSHGFVGCGGGIGVKIVAKRFIRQGEELTVDYLAGMETDVDGARMGVDERREMLARDWGFWCGCRRCVIEAKRGW